MLGGRASGRRLPITPIKLPINPLGCRADGGGVTGSLRQRGTSSWELRVYAGTDAASGRRRYRTATVTGTRADAERALAALVASVHSSRRVGSESTMTELLERWFETASANWSPSTVRQTRSVLRRQLIPHLGDTRVGELTPASIDDLYGRLRAGGGVDGRPLAAGTVKRVHVVLHSALAQAVRWGWAWDNPAERAHRLVATAREPRPPTPETLAALLAHVVTVNPDFHALLVLAATTGARRAQLLGLRWRDINLQEGRVAFCHGWVEGEHGPVLTETKSKRRHSVDLDDTTIAVLARLAARRAETGHVNVEGFAFSADGSGEQAWKPNWVTKTFLRYQRACGVAPFRLHDLRHFMATHMLDLGVPVTVVSRRLDHRRVSTTLDYYSHVVPGRDRFAATALSNRLNKAGTEGRAER